MEVTAIPSKGTVVLICFEDGAGRSLAASVGRHLGLERGLDSRCRWHGPGLLSVHVERAVEPDGLESLRGLSGVRAVTAMPLDRGLTSKTGVRGDSAVVLPNGAVVGDGAVVSIAGPCSVESAAQICEIAEAVRDAGACALRGGAFKPRTSPYAFGGLGEKGLEHLALARERTGLPVVTELLDAADIDLVARFSDVLQIGSRNMHNFPLLFKAGSHPSGKPILLKRGFAATLDEFLQAAEYVLLGRLSLGLAEPRLILCERGIRSAADATRFTLDVGAIAVLRDKTHLPVIADPSHAAGDRRYVAPLALAAVAAGADGVLVEVHTDPARAWSDGPQCVDPGAFRELMEDVRRLESLRLEGSRRPSN